MSDYDEQSNTLLGVVAHRIHDILAQENEGMADQRSNDIAEAVLDELGLSEYADWDHSVLTIGRIDGIEVNGDLRPFSETINEDLDKEE